jgi:hypothetical protein
LGKHLKDPIGTQGILIGSHLGGINYGGRERDWYQIHCNSHGGKVECPDRYNIVSLKVERKK